MAEDSPTDPFVRTDEIEVDENTLAAINRGIRAADEGRVVSSEEVRKLIPRWISKFSGEDQR
jgi:predicted transcriptional regulator